MDILQQIQKEVIGNMLNDEFAEYTDHTLLSEKDFTDNALKGMFLFIAKNRINGTNDPIYSKYDIDLITECMDVGIVYTKFVYNVNVLKKYNAKNKLDKMFEVVKSVDENGIDSLIIDIRNTIENIEVELNHNNMNVENGCDILTSLVSTDEIKYTPTGFSMLDEMINQLESKRLTLVAGNSHSGKSVVVRTLIANAIHNKRKVLWMIGENEKTDELRRLCETVIGNNEKYYDYKKINLKYAKFPKPNVTKALKKWMGCNLRTITKSEAKLKNHNEMFSLIEKELRNTKHDLIVIDNLMSVLTINNSNDKNNAQADFVQKCCDLAKIYNTHIILVLHPRKDVDTKSGNYDAISGTSDMANKADNIIFITRNNAEKIAETNINGYITVAKNKRWGELGEIPLSWCEKTSTYYEIKENNGVGKIGTLHYDIEKYMDTTIKAWNGTEQTFEHGEFAKLDDEPF